MTTTLSALCDRMQPLPSCLRPHTIKSKGLKAFVLSSNKFKFYIFRCVIHTNNSILLLHCLKNIGYYHHHYQILFHFYLSMLLNLTPRNHTNATWLTNTRASSSYETASGRAAGTASNKMKTGPRTLSPRVLHRGTLLELTHHWIMDGDLQVPPKGSEKLGMVAPTGVPGLGGWRQDCGHAPAPYIYLPLPGSPRFSPL